MSATRFLMAVGFLGVGLADPALPRTVEAQQPAAAEAYRPNDYSNGDHWLCRPGRQDACAVDLTTTVVASDGSLTTESFTPHPNPPIDCFYVYPTVSTDTEAISDMTADPAELNVIHRQFARFRAVCRPYAPMYRQVTLAGLRSGTGAAGMAESVGYQDVVDAWNHYLENDNQGRGVVLIGHSQGSYVLTRMVAEEIDGEPVQDRLVSALLIGATVAVAEGRDVGGAFDEIPLCRSASQTGCLIAYSSYRSNVPPPADTRFGRVTTAGQEAACVNPAALGGGEGELHAYMSTPGSGGSSLTPPDPWVTPAREIETPFVSVPGLLTARCASNEFANFLEITVHGNPADPRTDDIVGDIGSRENPTASWGLHLIDMNLAMGNLVEIVRRQGEAWVASSR
jgi:hypothetical protein